MLKLAWPALAAPDRTRPGGCWHGGPVAAFVLVLLGGRALATDVANPLQPPSLARPDFLRQSAENFQLPPVEAPAAPSPAAPTTTGLRIERVIFRGNTVFPTAELEALVAPVMGRDLAAPELEDLRQKLTRQYIDRGYVNSGVLLAPDSSATVLVFDVIEGRLTAVRVAGMERLDEAYVVRRLVKETDGPLNLEVLRERFQLLLADPLFSRMNGRLTPGERPGEAYFDVDVARALPYQLSASFNNYRPPSIGSESVGLSGWVRNLTGHGDLLEANLRVPTEQSSGARTSLAWRMPLGYGGTQLSVLLDHGRSSVIEEPTRVLNIESTLRSSEIGISQTVGENLRHKLALGIDRVQRENRTYLLGLPFSFNPGEPNGVTRERLWRFWQDYAYRTETSVLAFRSTLTSGRNNLQVIAGLPGSNDPPQQFDVWLGQAQYVRQVMDNGAQAILKVAIQHTGDRLLALDGLSIGGVHTVRGFRENQLVRDVGAVFNLEFEYPLVRGSGKNLSATVVPFYDHGRGWNKGAVATTISSWGIASRIRWNSLSLDLTLAKRLSSPPLPKGPTSTLQDKGVHFQLAYAFF